MAENILPETPSAETIKAVNSRLEQLSLDLIALYELAVDVDAGQTLLQSMIRACAWDVDRCTVALGGESPGYVENHFGRV